MRKVIVLVLSIIMIMCSTAFAFAEVDIAQNYLDAGKDVSCANVNATDIILVGENASVANSKANSNVYMAGADISISGSTIEGDIATAGKDLSLESSVVGGNVFLAGYKIELSDMSVAGTAKLAGSDITVKNGSILKLDIAGNDVVLDGYIIGDCDINANNVTIGDNCVVKGNLFIESANSPKISSKADIANYRFEKTENDDDDVKLGAGIAGVVSALFFAGIVRRAVKIILMLILCLIFSWLFKKSLDNAKEMAKERTGALFGYGAIALFATPIISLILFCTIIGIPFALILIMIYGILLWVSTTFTAVVVGRMIFPKMNKVGASLLGTLIFGILLVVPVIRTVLGFACNLVFLGFVAIRTFGKKEKKEESKVSPDGFTRYQYK